MALLIFVLFAVLAAGSGILMLVARMRLLDSAAQSNRPLPEAARYRPMLRLLSDEDLNFAARNPGLRAKVAARRRELFRGYVRCLTKDYAGLLARIRRLMVESGVDRPDLAKALAKNRFVFALALCRIELHLRLHALGLSNVDVSGLVEALDGLRATVNVMTPVAAAAPTLG
ncbi:MAG TPA: hypothetical protein VHC72_11655 [Bryobacteraceae bacterium]|nr:hypothetical protein [Bryobacteraceae bacterium]